MVIVNVTGTAHGLPVGVNVYTTGPVLPVLMAAGFHVPLIPLVESNGKSGAVAFWQRFGMASNTGVIGLFTLLTVVASAMKIHPLKSFTETMYEPAARLLCRVVVVKTPVLLRS